MESTFNVGTDSVKVALVITLERKLSVTLFSLENIHSNEKMLLRMPSQRQYIS